MKNFVLAAALTSLLGCVHVLDQVQFMTDRVHRATAACVAKPSGPVGSQAATDKIKLCTQVQTCKDMTESALEALKDAQTAQASGSVDVAKEAAAAGKGALANLACKGL